VTRANPLLAAVLANPEDDSPRLVYADWLEENDDVDRARFIRAQCELARLPVWNRRRRELARLAAGLETRCGARWRSELPALEGVTWADFERGFVSTVRVEQPQPLYQHDASIAAAAPVHRAELPPFDETNVPRPEGSLPWLRTLRLVRPQIAGIEEFTPHQGHSLIRGLSGLELVDSFPEVDARWVSSRASQMPLSALSISGEYGDGEAFARALAGAAGNWKLTRLELGNTFVNYHTGYYDDSVIGVSGARDLAQGRGLTSLTSLDLARQRIRTPGLTEILTSPHFQGVRELKLRSNEIDVVEAFRQSEGAELLCLDLSENAIREPGAAALADSPRLAALACLELDNCEIPGDAVERLSGAPFWGTLCRLNLSRNPLGRRGAQALERSGASVRLHDLRLVDCHLGLDAAAVLGRIPWLAGLQRLDLSWNNLSPGGLFGAGFLMKGNLQELSLARTVIGAEDVTSLAPLWGQLVSLDLSDNDVGNGLELLAATGPAHNLQTLRVRKCGLSSSALEAVVRAGACPNLRTLVFADNLLSTAALRMLVRSPLASQLDELDVSNCGLSDEAGRLLADTPGLGDVRRLDLRNNPFGEQANVRMARSEHLRSVPELLLTGTPWDYSPDSQYELRARLGEGWAFRRDDERQEVDE
jgi:uncharacterized protein (TIGR02996 family)